MCINKNGREREVKDSKSNIHFISIRSATRQGTATLEVTQRSFLQENIEFDNCLTNGNRIDFRR